MDITIILLNIVDSWLNILILTITNLQIIWITYPTYITWISMEYFVEKEGIHYSHALANSIIFSWVSIDWLRELYETSNIYDLPKLFIALGFLSLSIFILISAAKRKKIAKLLGKTGVFAYFQIFLTPFMYNLSSFNINNIISIIAFFPIIYLIVYLIDKYLPSFIDEEIEQDDNNYDINNNYQDYNQYNYSNNYGQNYNYQNYNRYYNNAYNNQYGNYNYYNNYQYYYRNKNRR
ncbi:hypothetical protein MJ1_0320 [Nanobdella aerobiophila]|uniref:Uncharacterized protein n=1 Tax=Nanobdella aerobiophila TaxID=2586965 RepID=A0A915SY23_9ARCH|nr:hypothetical protein [Nanobdella aerobiophila]BBL45485.1 hypothetical protein MJ1_0320 [Nanobdella aerobiophila]